MKLQTTIEIKPSPWKATMDTRWLMLGSCFADEIGEQMQQRYLNVTCNPFGTLYNPLSIAQAINYQIFESSNLQIPLVEYDGLWHSMAHHGSFSRRTKEEAEAAVRDSIDAMQTALREADVIIVTFGTAWIYEWNKGKSVCQSEEPSVTETVCPLPGYERAGLCVANCHKMPADWFTRRRLTVDEIVAAWKPVLERFRDKHWIFTVSPIRHVKDGLHENQLSKATLLLAIERLTAVRSCSETVLQRSVQYFDSFEILLDELRDYRFYADDLVHPSSMAVNYIWERFCETFFSPQTRNELILAHKRWQFEHHRPLH